MTSFERATVVGADGAATVHDGWDIFGNANGGYLMALAARGMLQAAGRRHPVSVTAHYLSPGRTGPAQLDTTVVKQGRRFATVTAQLRHEARPILQLVGAFGDLADAQSFEHHAVAPPDLLPFDECVRRTSADDPAVPALQDRFEVRLDPRDTGFARGAPSGDARIAGWFRFHDDDRVDPLALLMVCDAFPPAVFNLDMPPGWVPTVELTVHVRAVPAPGPLMCVFRTHFVGSGFLNEDGEVWDSTGRLVAQSRQLGLTPLR